MNFKLAEVLFASVSGCLSFTGLQTLAGGRGSGISSGKNPFHVIFVHLLTFCHRLLSVSNFGCTVQPGFNMD